MPLQDVAALPTLAIPEPYRRVVAGRCQRSAIGGPGKVCHRAGMSFQRRPARAGFHFPEPDRLVVAAAGEQRSIRSEDQLSDLATMTMQFSEQRPLFGVPQPDDGIEPAAGKHTSIWAPGYGQNPPPPCLKTMQFCPGSHIPKVESSIKTPAHQLAVGAHGKGGDRNVLIPYRPDGGSTGQGPESDGTVPTGSSQRLSIGAEGDGTHAIGMPPDGQVRYSSLDEPDPHLPAVTARRDVAPIGADGHRKHRVEGFGEGPLVEPCPGKGRILHLDALQVGPANGEPGQVQAAQMAAQVFEQAEDVGGAIALEGRPSASSASNSCARSTRGCRTCARVGSSVHSRSTANQVSSRCSRGVRRPICWRSTGRTPLKISSPSCRNRSRFPLKRSEIACATIFKARGLPA